MPTSEGSVQRFGPAAHPARIIIRHPNLRSETSDPYDKIKIPPEVVNTKNEHMKFPRPGGHPSTHEYGGNPLLWVSNPK